MSSVHIALPETEEDVKKAAAKNDVRSAAGGKGKSKPAASVAAKAPAAAAAAATGAAPAATAASVTTTASAVNAKAAASVVTPNAALPVVCIVIGMAGSGKTTLMQRLNAHVHERKIASYIINLDPAVTKLPYGANIDIRETVNYKEVMKQYHLGPNGGILTSLNLFATRFDQVLGFVEKKADKLKHVFVDTPGQIEIFTWSASGTIIADSLAAAFPTVLVYVVDTPRNTSPVTFMSNMMYACSIMYKTKLPFLIVFNKVDVMAHDFAVRWMSDIEAFDAALKSDQTYMSSLTRSMSLVLTEFYHNIRTVGVSAASGVGMPQFFAAVEDAGREYWSSYRPMLAKRVAEKQQKEGARIQADLARLQRDMADTRGQNVLIDGNRDGKTKPKSKPKPKPNSNAAPTAKSKPPATATKSTIANAADGKSAPASGTASGTATATAQRSGSNKQSVASSAGGDDDEDEDGYNELGSAPGDRDGDEDGGDDEDEANAAERVIRRAQQRADRHHAQHSELYDDGDGDGDEDEDPRAAANKPAPAGTAKRAAAAAAAAGLKTATAMGSPVKPLKSKSKSKSVTVTDADEDEDVDDDGAGDDDDDDDDGDDGAAEDETPDQRAARRSFGTIPVKRTRDPAEEAEFREFMRLQATKAAAAAATAPATAPATATASSSTATAKATAAVRVDSKDAKSAAPIASASSAKSGGSGAVSKFKQQSIAGTAPPPSKAALEADQKAAAAAAAATATAKATATEAKSKSSKPAKAPLQPNLNAAKSAKPKLRTQFLPLNAQLSADVAEAKPPS